MDFKISDLFTITRRRWILIVTVIFVTVAVTGWLSLRIIPAQYEAVASLLLNPQYINNQISYDDLLAKEKLVPTLGLAITSRRITADVINRLNLKISEEELLKHVEVNSIRSSMVTTITVTYPDSGLAVKIANAFAYSSRDNLPGITDVQNISVLDEAKYNPRPVSPKPVFNMAVAFLLAFNISAGFAVLAEILDKTVKTEAMLVQLVDSPLLAALAKLRGKGNRRGGLICLEEPESPAAEEFRKLRINLRHTESCREASTLLITSALPGEGKSFIAANLGIVLAQEGKRVLLVDGDLRNPSQHKLFNIPNDEGLTAVLTNNSSKEKAVFHSPIGNLDVLPGGPAPPNPSELAALPLMMELIKYFKVCYDVVLLDSSSVIPVTDTQVLAEFTDAVLFVTKLRHTRCEDVNRAVEMLTLVGAEIAGTVANYKTDNAAGYYYKYKSEPPSDSSVSGGNLETKMECV